MTALKHIVWKELRDTVRQPRSLAVVGVVAVLLTVAALTGVPAHRSAERWKAEATVEVRRQWVDQGVRHPHAAAHYGIYAFRPLESTALIEPGVSTFVGQMLSLQTHQRGFPLHRPADDRTSAVRLAALSPAQVSLTLLPLIIVLIGHRAVSGEREDGNLSVLLAAGVEPRTLVSGKLLALALVGTGAVCLKTTIDASAMALTAAPMPFGRLLGLEGVHAAYVLVWVCLAVGVSARVRTSQTALAILLALWVANSFVLPRVAASVGRLVVREPSVEEFRADMQHDITYRPDGTPWVEGWSTSLIAETLRRYGVERVEDLPVGYAGIMLKGSDAHYEQVFDVHFARLHTLHRRQEVWHHVLSVLGPVVAARSLGQAFAGTDLTHAHHFADAAERYRRSFVEATNDAIEHGTTGTGWDLRTDHAFWESIPAFHYAPPSTLWAVRQHAVSVTVLVAWLVAAAFWSVRGHLYLGAT